MTKRAEATEATRRRIVAATVAAHRELGIQATSWDEIARRAGVGVGTVYRHFPTIEALLPACGEVVEATLAFPRGGEMAEVFAGASSMSARIDRLVGEVFGAYERGAPFIENIRRERGEVPALEFWHRQVERTLDAFTSQALKPVAPGERVWDVVRALIDPLTWQAFQARGFTSAESAHAVSELIRRSLRSSPNPRPGRHET
jgi:AcrR family transcriptional regulator